MFNSLFSNCSPYEKGFTWNPFHFEAYSLWSWNPFHFEAYSLWSWNPFHFEAYSLWSLAGWIIDCIVKGLEKYYKIKTLFSLACMISLTPKASHFVKYPCMRWAHRSWQANHRGMSHLLRKVLFSQYNITLEPWVPLSIHKVM